MIITGLPGRPAARREPGLVPLTDIVFLLLLFFMLAGQVRPADVAAVLPPGSASEARPEGDRVELLVEADGTLWLGSDRVDLAALAPALAARARKAVLVKADADLPVATLRAVLAELRGAGVREAALATRPRYRAA